MSTTAESPTTGTSGNEDPDGERDLATPVSVLAAVGAAGFLIFAFLWSANRGFDLTDEGFHLNTLRHASVAPQGGSQFGQIVRMLTFGQTLSVAGYRVLGLVLLEASAALVALAFCRFVGRRMPDLAPHLPPRAAVVATAMAGGGLGYSWLPRTVSYLVLTPAFLCVIAALTLWLAARDGEPRQSLRLNVGAAAAIGAVGSLLFYTKFSSAAAGLVLAVLAVAVGAGIPRAALIASVSASFFVLVTIVLDATTSFSIGELFQRASSLSGGSHSASALQTAYWNEIRHLFVPTAGSALCLGLVLVAILVVLLGRGAGRFLAAFVCVAVGALGFVHFLGSRRPPWELAPIVVFAGIGAAVVGIAAQRVGQRRSRAHTDSFEPAAAVVRPPRDRRAWIALALVVVGFPLAGSAGTNTGLFEMALSTGALLALGAVALAAEWRAGLPARVRGNALVAAPLVLVLACGATVTGRSLTNHLYRVARPASAQTGTVAGSAPLSGLRLDPPTKSLVDQVLAAASRAPGVRARSPILTSANLEGLAYALDGYVPGTGWIDTSDTTCGRLAKSRRALTQVDLLVLSDPLGPALDKCFRRTVPGYPDAFSVISTVDVAPALQQQIGVRRVAVLRRN